MIATMAYSFARISAVTALKLADVFRQKQRLWLRLAEKGGKSKDVPCHHRLEAYLTEWMSACGHVDMLSAPLFQTFTTTGRRVHGARILSGRPMSQAMTWEMIQRRSKAAGIETTVCNHTFRATGITAYLSNGGTIERAALIAGHASTRTTQLYDRRPDDVTLDEIEKIRFE
jgi:integrase